MRTQTRRIRIVRESAPCPCCGRMGKRHSLDVRLLHEVGVTCLIMLDVTYSKHYCQSCRRHFAVDMSYLAPPSGHYTHRVRLAALEMVICRNMTLDRAVNQMRAKRHVHVPMTTLHGWIVEARGGGDARWNLAS